MAAFNSSASNEAWELHRQGKFRQAIAAYTALYEDSSDIFYLRGRGDAKLELGEYASALDDFLRAEAECEPRYRDALLYIARGVCWWWLGQPAQAVEAWTLALDAPYQDAAGGVIPPALLLYAAERLDAGELRREAVRLLRKHARRRLGDWPGAIVPFLLGKIEAAQLEHAASVSTALIPRHRCQADFYIGLGALRTGDRAGFSQRMQRAVSWDGMPRKDEHYLAKWEVAHAFPEKVGT
jgi:tetratricopeptide (TPR) repeat protein